MLWKRSSYSRGAETYSTTTSSVPASCRQDIVSAGYNIPLPFLFAFSTPAGLTRFGDAVPLTPADCLASLISLRGQLKISGLFLRKTRRWQCGRFWLLCPVSFERRNFLRTSLHPSRMSHRSALSANFLALALSFLFSDAESFLLPFSAFKVGFSGPFSVDWVLNVSS